ncbi:monofunctional biosynthetic peptidoglycan transglycosylase [Thermaurantimonas aggregans]|uniref:Biosynthetic peptidoglycan transglycosylase n=1 Tax=Thermaurantimonas aggregans TaxID=2173829 RepID=A0A401XJ62_9FLAO|nr:monofunctional biosynthetic peptidoglycan transglycosylase [Thermaurantimonas aggregans]MCX8148970.1 monofunctional biosynthetic peptidoglycan transglycosylase [Thermaurantimonas aggregans]GCD77014.1 monofunctional biosynthetic peptidoglycan transglycosylase [Thermaurantimonas aggregans]
MKKLSKVLLRIFVYFIIITHILVWIYRFLPVPFTPLMVFRYIEHYSEGIPFRYHWVKARNISQHAYLAAIVSEDQNFFKHSGFDLKAIEKAIEHNKRNTRRKRGASTISQQLAKNLFLWPGRSWIRKGLEAYFTVLIELYWPKKKILSTYLNVVEMGKNTFGIEAAARKYFRKSAAELTAAQAAQIIAILPSPRRWSVNPPGPYVQRRSAWIQRQMRLFGGTSYLALNECCY